VLPVLQVEAYRSRSAAINSHHRVAAVINNHHNRVKLNNHRSRTFSFVAFIWSIYVVP
jgi:hypothetical protein